MEIVYKKLEELKPYEKNPRNNDNAIEYVKKSIQKFGFKVPMVIDKKGVIVTGHTRYKACQQLGIEEVPCIVADDLTPQQIKAFRIADNKTNDMAEWNDELLGEELKDLLPDIDMTDFGFGDFEISMLTEDMEPEDYDKDLIEQYSSNSDDFLINKRIIITYKSDEEKEFLKRLINEENDTLKVVYTAEELIGMKNE